MRLIDELRQRFNLQHGRFFAQFKYKNLNWYLGDDWFLYGDIREDDIPRLQALLQEGEELRLGWKELPPHTKSEPFFGDGGGLWLKITKDEVVRMPRL